MDNKNPVEIKENTLYLLYRRGKQEHIKALYEKGEVYINSIDFIRECDKNEDRSDINDGILKRKFIGEAEIRMCDVGRDIELEGTSFNTLNLSITTDHVNRGNIYCLSGVYGDHLLSNESCIEFNTKTFGQALILIYNPKEFLNRIKEALKKEGFDNMRHKRVTYYSNDYSGQIGFFKKHEKFKQQNEHRIFIPNEQNKAIMISIGSLADIAAIENNSFIKVSFTDYSVKHIRIS